MLKMTSKRRRTRAQVKADKEMAAALTEKTREPLVSAIRDAFQPVVHSIRIVSE